MWEGDRARAREMNGIIERERRESKERKGERDMGREREKNT